jgi:hypothetical protein
VIPKSGRRRPSYRSCRNDMEDRYGILMVGCRPYTEIIILHGMIISCDGRATVAAALKVVGGKISFNGIAEMRLLGLSNNRVCTVRASPRRVIGPRACISKSPRRQAQCQAEFWRLRTQKKREQQSYLTQKKSILLPACTVILGLVT